jgi:hypothetical protein
MPGMLEPQLHCLLIGADPLLNFALELGNAVFQKGDVRKALLEQDPVMRLNASLKRLLELRQFAPQSATGQIGQGFGIADSLDHGR